MPSVRSVHDRRSSSTLKLFAAGGAASAVAVSTCGVLPLALGSLGFGGTLASRLGVLAAYQTPFRLAAVALLGAGFWFVFARRPTKSEGATCAPGHTAGWVKLVLWAGTLVLAVVLSETVWRRWLA